MQMVFLFQCGVTEGVVAQSSFCIACKGRMWLVIDMGFYGDIVACIGYFLWGRIVREGVALCVQIVEGRQSGCGAWNEGIGAFEVVVLEGGLVDLADDNGFIDGVGACRI